MAVLCSKCGADVPAGAQFCAACGAAVVPGAPPPSSTTGSGFTPVNVPSQPISTPQPPLGPTAGTQPLPGYTPVQPPPPPPSGYAQPVATAPVIAAGYTPPPPPPTGAFAQPAAARPGGGGSALKIILIIVAILIGLGILGAGAVGFMVWRVAHAIHVGSHGGQITLNTPEGSVTTSKANDFSADELGTDIYPGAKSTSGGMRMALPSGSIVSAVFVTPDSKDQVLSFYKSKFGSDASVFDNTNSAMISLKKGAHENIMVSISARPSENDGQTKISIVHTRNKGAS
jgi:hypothetical protein